MYNLNLALEREIRSLIDEQLTEAKERLANGLSTPDYETYKFQVGKIAGLMQALELLEDAKTNVSKKY